MAENEIAVTQKNEVIQQVDMKTISEYLDTTGLTSQLQPNEKAMFINMARDYGLNPFKREIYCTVYGEGQWRKCSIVTGYEVYLKRAERIGKLDGWNCQIAGSLQDCTLSATVTIYRKDWSHPFTHTAYYIECVNKNKNGQPNAIWAKMPIFMTKKVAIAQAFRLCFSDEFGGMPYTSDEISGEPIVGERDITNEATATVQHEVTENQQTVQEPVPVMNMDEIRSAEITDTAIALEQILNDNKRYFRRDEFEKAQLCLQNGTTEQIEAMYKWACGYVEWANGQSKSSRCTTGL